MGRRRHRHTPKRPKRPSPGIRERRHLHDKARYCTVHSYMHRTDCECVRVAETNQESEVRTLHRVCRAMIARALGAFGLFFGAVRRVAIPAGSLVFVLARWAFG